LRQTSKLWPLTMNEEYKFCYHGDMSNVKSIKVCHDASWSELLSSLRKTLEMSFVSYIELIDSSDNVVGERIGDMEDFFTSCRYVDGDMVFKVFGSGQRQVKKYERPVIDSSFLDSSTGQGIEAYNPMDDFSRSAGGAAVVKKKSKQPIVAEEHTMPNMPYANHVSHTDSGSNFPSQSTHFDEAESTHDMSTPARNHMSDGPMVSTSPSSSQTLEARLPPAQSPASALDDTPDFSTSLQSILAGISKIEETIEFPSDYSRALSYQDDSPAQSQYVSADYSSNKKSMASLKTSAELEMERLHAEEEKRREQALEDARKLREMLEAERAGRERQAEEARRRAEEEEAKKPVFVTKSQRTAPPSMYGNKQTASSNDDEDDDEEEWARAEEDKARRRAQEVERKKRVDTISAQRRTLDTEGNDHDHHPDSERMRAMGGVKLPAMRLNDPVDVSFRSVLNMGQIVPMQLENQCDWIDLTTTVGVYLGLDSPEKITHFVLVDEDGDETSGQVTDDEKFWKFHSRRYLSGEGMSFVVHHSPNDPKKPAMYTSRTKETHRDGDGKTGDLNFRLSTDYVDEKVAVSVPPKASWVDVCGAISRSLKLSPGAVMLLSLFDDEGDELVSGIDGADMFWKVVQTRYSQKSTVFVVMVDESSAVSSPTTAFYCSLVSDKTKRESVKIPDDGDWEKVGEAIVGHFRLVGKRLNALTLIDEDGDVVFAGITTDKKFWKAAKSRYESDSMFFVASLEDAPISVAPALVKKQVLTVPLLCSLSVDKAKTKKSVNVPVDGDWEAIDAAIVDAFQLEGQAVEAINLIDEDGDEVMGAITSDKKFWKAVNSRYTGDDMVFVVSLKKSLVVVKKKVKATEAAAAVPAKPVVPTTPFNFRLSTDSPGSETVVAVPVNGTWEEICASVFEAYGYSPASKVVSIDLLDTDGDEMMGSISNDKKFWKAAKRYDASDTTFVVAVDVVAGAPPLAQLVEVPTASVLFRLFSDDIEDRAVVDIPIGGNWDDITAPITAFFELHDSIIDHISLFDDDGDEIFGSIKNDIKFWKAVNTRYDSNEMVFVVFFSKSTIAHVAPVGPTVSFSFCLPNDEEAFTIAIPDNGSWIAIRNALAGFFNFSSGDCVTHLQLVDNEWDDVFSKIVDDNKFWKAANTKFVEGETYFVVYHDESIQSSTSSIYSAPAIPRASYVPSAINYEPPTPGGKFDGQMVTVNCKLSTDYIGTTTNLLIPAMGTWDKVTEVFCESFHLPSNTIIDHVDLIDDEGDVIVGNIVSASKFWNVVLEKYRDGSMMFNITQKAPTINPSRHAGGGMYNTAPSSGGGIYSSAKRELSDRTDSQSESTMSFGRGQQSLNTSNGSGTRSVSSTGTDKVSPEVAMFLSACGDGDIAAAGDVLAKGGDINMKDSAGLTGLHVACIRGAMKMVEFLVEKEASISCRDLDGMTPLHFACENDHTQIAIYIVRMGGDTSLRNRSGLTSLHYLCMNGNMQLTVLIRDYMINVATSSGLTLLHCAADMGHAEMVEYLLEHEAQVQPRDDEGLTPIHMAAMGGHIEVVEILLEFGAYWNVRDDEGNSPLLHAAKDGNIDMVDFLIEVGGNVLARNDKGESALHMACDAGSMDLVKFLLEKNMDINCRNKKGETPLDIASASGHDHLVEWMEDRGATMRPESRDEAATRSQVEAKTESAARAFEAEEELNLQREIAEEQNGKKKR
jgi:ankyrin repeat protein